MRLYLFNYFLINIFIMVNAISEECIKLNNFLGISNEDCCNTQHIKCTDEGRISRIEL